MSLDVLFMPKLMLHPQLALWTDKRWDFYRNWYRSYNFHPSKVAVVNLAISELIWGKRLNTSTWWTRGKTKPCKGTNSFSEGVRAKQGLAAPCRPGNWGTTGLAGTSPAPTPQCLRKADAESMNRVSPGSRSSNKSLVAKQVRGHTTKSTHRSGTGLKLGEPDPAELETSPLLAGLQLELQTQSRA